MRRLTIFSAFAAGMLALAPFSAALASPSSPYPSASFAESSDAPQYISSEPVNGTQVHEAPKVVKVAFSEPLDPSSKLRVFACGERVDDGKVTVSLNQLEVGLASGPTGIYEASWIANGLAGMTGTSEGFIEFAVGHEDNPSCAGAGHPPGHGGGEDASSGHGGSGGSHEGDSDEGASHESTSHEGTSHEGASGASHLGAGDPGATHSGASTSSSHQGNTHSTGAGGSQNHSSGSDDSQSQTHGSENGDHTSPTDEALGSTDLAASGAPLPVPTPEAGVVFFALITCIGLGISGGWLARLL